MSNDLAEMVRQVAGAANAEHKLICILGKILRAHESGNNGAYIGEAKLCHAFAHEARDALVAAGPAGVAELMPRSLVEAGYDPVQDDPRVGGEPRRDYHREPRTLARTNDPDTSHAAARSVDTLGLERRVLEYVRSRGIDGCIQDDAIAHFKTLPYSSVTARFKALLDDELIFVAGKRPGKSGRQQRVYVATPTQLDLPTITSADA